MNTKQQGNIGLGCAISYFTSIGYGVSIPLNDSQKYDLVVDDGKKLNMVQVKTTRRKSKSGNFLVQLRTKGGSRKTNLSTLFDNNSVDLLFVLCGDGRAYLFESKDIAAKSDMTVGDTTSCNRIIFNFTFLLG